MEKSPYILNGLTDCDEIWHGGSSETPTTANQPLKFPKFENPKWRTAAILKNQEMPYLPKCLTDFDKIWQGNAFGAYIPVRVLKIYDFENLIWQNFL